MLTTGKPGVGYTETLLSSLFSCKSKTLGNKNILIFLESKYNIFHRRTYRKNLGLLSKYNWVTTVVKTTLQGRSGVCTLDMVDTQRRQALHTQQLLLTSVAISLVIGKKDVSIYHVDLTLMNKSQQKVGRV